MDLRGGRDLVGRPGPPATPANERGAGPALDLVVSTSFDELAAMECTRWHTDG